MTKTKLTLAVAVLTVVSAGFVNSALAKDEDGRRPILHGKGCIEAKGQFYLHGKMVNDCRQARTVDVPKEPRLSSYDTWCNGKKPGESRIVQKGNRAMLAVCR